MADAAKGSLEASPSSAEVQVPVQERREGLEQVGVVLQRGDVAAIRERFLQHDGQRFNNAGQKIG